MRRFMPARKTCLIALAFLCVVAGVACWQRCRILSWYYVGQLARAGKGERDAWIERIVALGEPCMPGLIDRLGAGPDAVRANVAPALTALAAHWGPDDARTEALLQRLRIVHADSDTKGKTACLDLVSALLENQPADRMLPASLAKSSAEMLALAAPELELHHSCLCLARAFLQRVPPGQGASLCRDLALAGLARTETPLRLAAVRVALQPPLNTDKRLLEKVVPLLRDPDAELRKTSLLALAGQRDLVDDDDLLPLLHDDDLEVQRICELALRSRGLQDSHILLARLISDPSPSARLLVLDRLRQAPDLEPGVWLQRLSADPAPAVRAAAVRAAAGQKQVDLRARISEMASKDPSPTVRQLAGFYLTRGLSRVVEE